MSYLPGCTARTRSQPGTVVGTIDHPDDFVGQRAPRRAWDDARVAIVRQDVDQPVRVGGHDGLPHRQRLEDGERRALPERGNTLRSNADSTRRARRADEPGEHEAVAEPERAPALRARPRSGPSPTRKNLALGRRSRTSRGGIDEVRSCLSTRAGASRCRRRSRPARCRARAALGGDLLAPSPAAELVERRAEIDDLDLRRRNLPRLDHEVRGARRHGDSDDRCTARAARSATF